MLVLSEFAGVASEMPEALKMHPYDLVGTAEVMAAALAIPQEERQRRMQAMRAAVTAGNVHGWVSSFLDELDAGDHSPTTAPGDFEALQQAATEARARGPLTLFLDYDGTLVEFAARPELAVPDPALLENLRLLAEEPGIDVHIVSGRPRDFLEHWFGSLPVGLHAEHGLASRSAGEPHWTIAPLGNTNWQSRVQMLLKRFAAQVPGTLVETKAHSVAFHYRQVDAEFAKHIVSEIRLHLTEMLSQSSATVLSGNRVLEVRPLASTRATSSRA